jgi:hypothetical protein
MWSASVLRESAEKVWLENYRGGMFELGHATCKLCRQRATDDALARYDANKFRFDRSRTGVRERRANRAQGKMKTQARTCLYCNADATSPEHFIPAAIGGVLQPRITCPKHNGIVDRLCDNPLIEQFQYIVHLLKVVKDRRGRGVAVTLQGEDGNQYRVDEEHRVAPVRKVLERDESGKPTKVMSPSREDAENFLSSMGLSLEDPRVILEEHSGQPPRLSNQLQIGAETGFKGILKIAYEFVRGHQDAIIEDFGADEGTRQAIIGAGSAADYVRWLPYEMFGGFNQTPYFSHHIVAWQDGNVVLVIVELFNACPFVVRLPGLRLTKAVLYAQGIQREKPVFGTPVATPPWHWDNVPLDAQLMLLEEAHKRISLIIETSMRSDYLKVVCESAFEAILAASAEDSVSQIVEDAIRRAKGRLSSVDEHSQPLRLFLEHSQPLRLFLEHAVEQVRSDSGST